MGPFISAEAEFTQAGKALPSVLAQHFPSGYWRLLWDGWTPTGTTFTALEESSLKKKVLMMELSPSVESKGEKPPIPSNQCLLNPNIMLAPWVGR